MLLVDLCFCLDSRVIMGENGLSSAGAHNACGTNDECVQCSKEIPLILLFPS